jgi:hypothetical protein
MIDSRVKPQLIQKDESLVLSLLMQRHHVLRDITCCDKMFAKFDAYFPDDVMQKGRNVADDNIASIDKRFESGGVGDFD